MNRPATLLVLLLAGLLAGCGGTDSSSGGGASASFRLNKLQKVDIFSPNETETALIDDHILESFDIVSLVAALNDAFDIEIGAKDLVPENFNSAKSLLAMVQRLQDED